MAHLSELERSRGVITASAGNHSQGVAFSARTLGLEATIVMPQTTPRIKVDAVQAMGADRATATLRRRAGTLRNVTRRRAAFIHPFEIRCDAGQAPSLRDPAPRPPLTRHLRPVVGGGPTAGFPLRESDHAGGESHRRGPFDADRCTAPWRGRASARTLGISPTASRCAKSRATFAIVRETSTNRPLTNDELRRDQGRLRDALGMEPAGAWRRLAETCGREASATSTRRRPQRRELNFDRLRFVAEGAELGEAREACRRGDSRGGRVPEFSRRSDAASSPSSYGSATRHAHIFVGVPHIAAGREELATLLTGRGTKRGPHRHEMAKLPSSIGLAAGRPTRARAAVRFHFPTSCVDGVLAALGRWNSAVPQRITRRFRTRLSVSKCRTVRCRPSGISRTPRLRPRADRATPPTRSLR